MNQLLEQEPGLAQLAERQMVNWEVARRQRLAGSPEAPVANFICLSRAVGLEGELVAEGLHEKLGWPLFDKEILQFMAENDDCRRRIYANLDERDQGWLESIIHSLVTTRPVRDDYFHRLTATVSALARKGPGIFLGRAVDRILPKAVGLRVRLTASLEYRIRQIAARERISPERAAGEIAEVEAQRGRFIRNHFHIEGTEPHRYDIVINMERFSAEDAVELILGAFKIRGI